MSWELRNVGCQPFWSFYSHLNYNLCDLAFLKDILNKITVFGSQREPENWPKESQVDVKGTRERVLQSPDSQDPWTELETNFFESHR